MSSFERRTKLLQANDVPGQHETTDNLGEALGKTILKTMSPVAQRLMGVTEPLSTAPSQMWVDPNDLLKGDVVVRPPTTAACLKAFTHQKILDIGTDIEQKVQHETATLVDNAIGDTAEFERFVCKQKVDFAVKQGQEELRQVLLDQRGELLNIFQDDRQQMIEEHDEATARVVDCLKEQHRLTTHEKMLELTAEHEQRINEWEQKLLQAEHKHQSNVDELKEQMNMAVQSTRVEYFGLMKKLHAEFKQRLEEQKNQLQCQHMCELMHVICAEKSEAQNKLLKFQQEDQKNGVQQTTVSVIASPDVGVTPANSPQSLSQSSISKSKYTSSTPKSSKDCYSFLNDCIKDAADTTATPTRPFVIGACEIAQPPSVSTSVSSDSIALDSSLSSVEYDNCRYVKMTTTAIDPRLLRTKESDADDDISWKTIKDQKSTVSVVRVQPESMNNLVVDCHENATIVEIRSKLINILETVHELHPMTDSLQLVKSQIGNMINDLIDISDSRTSAIPCLVQSMHHSKLLSTTDSTELIPLRKSDSPIEITETPTWNPSEKIEISADQSEGTAAAAEHLIGVKNLQMTCDEYVESKKSFPSYMRQPQRNISATLFKTTPTTEPEWKKLLQTLQETAHKQSQELFTLEDVDGQESGTNVDNKESGQSYSMSETLKNSSRPNPILRKSDKTTVTIRSLLQILDRGDDDVAEHFFGRIPKKSETE